MVSDPRAATGKTCIQCEKCSPCPKGIPIPEVFRIMTLAETKPEAAAEDYEKLKQTAGRCVACRQCESRCPYCVPIVKTMRAAGSRFRK